MVPPALPVMHSAWSSMAENQHIDEILRDWPYEPDSVSVRLTEGDDGRDVIQMRIEMGVLQLETSGRPDGQRHVRLDQDRRSHPRRSLG